LATDVYKENFPRTKVVTKRLDKIPIKAFHNSIGEIDLLARFPGVYKSHLAKGNARRSEASRETAFQVLRFAQEFKPALGRSRECHSNARWRRYKSFMASMKAMGYKAREQVLNAKNFGVAQTASGYLSFGVERRSSQSPVDFEWSTKDCQKNSDRPEMEIIPTSR